jgi:predicted nuclease with RNAse H fold
VSERGTIIGVDLSGPTNTDDTAVVALRGADGEERAEFVALEQGLSDEEIVEFVDEVAGAGTVPVVGLDAPLSYNPGGGDRPADRTLRGELSERGFPGNSVMPPTMTRMIYLTARGMTVARMLEARREVGIVEVHPTSALLFRGVAESDATAIKSSAAARERIVAELRERAIEGLPEAVADSDHRIAACAAALAAAGWAAGEPRWNWPAEPPVHPYDVCC